MGTDVQELAARAKRLLLERDFAEAVRACRRLLLSRPDDDDTRLLLGRALTATERFDEARVEMMSLIRRRPDSATAHRLLGESFLKAKQPKRGEEYLRRALELDPEDDEAAELLEELESDPPPTSATVERWFDSAGVATIETPASFFDDGSEDRPATAPIQDAPPSIQIDPELAAMAESMASMRAEDTSASVELTDSLAGDETDALTDPEAEAPPTKPAAEPSAAPSPPPRRPRGTMMGIAGLGQLAPGLGEDAGSTKAESTKAESTKAESTGDESTGDESTPFGEENTSELGIDELEAMPARAPARAPAATPKRPATSELDAGDLELVDSKEIFEPLDDDSEPLEAEATNVAGSALAPLEEEATQLRMPQESPRSDEPDHTRDLRVAAVMKAGPRSPKPVAQAPRPISLPPPPGPPPSAAAPPGALPMSASPAPPAAYASPSPSYAPPPPSYASPPAYVPALAPPPVAPPPAARPRVSTPPIGMPAASVSTPRFGAAPRVDPQPPQGFSPAGAPAPSPAAAAGPPADFTPAASPRASIPERRPVSTTEASRAVGVPDRLRQIVAHVRGLRDKLPNPKLFPLLLAAPVVVLALIVGSVMYFLDRSDDQEIASALLAATDDGRGASVDRAIARDADEGDTDDEAVRRRAHLLALAAYEAGRDTGDEASGLLRGLDDEARASLDARLARAYLSLRGGDIEGADTALAVRRSAEDPTGEVGHVHALVAIAHGDFAQASVEARASVAARPESPRHRALLALAQAFDGHAASALVDLAAQPGAAHDPEIRAAEARIRWATGDESGARDAATAVVEELSSVANPRERAWAHAVRAFVALANGDTEAAKVEARAAREEGAPGDESLTLAVAETLARAGDASGAAEVMAALGDQSPLPHARAQTAARVALEAGDAARAEAALANAGDSPQTAYLRGRLAEAQGDAPAARRAYEAAEAHADVEVEARVRLGAMALRADDAAQAVTVLGPALERAPADVWLVPVMARALLADGQRQRAADVVTAALRARPGAYPLAVANARVKLARGHGEAAQAALETLTTSHGSDAELWALLGAAARVAEHAPRAKEAYEKALEIQPGNVDALLGLLDLAIAQSDVAAGHDALDRAATAGVTGRPLELGRAHLMVLEGRGAQAVPSLSRLCRGTRDASLYAALGQAYVQAEDTRSAKRAFSRAIHYDSEEFDAHIGLASIGIHTGGSQLRRAAGEIGVADRIVQSHGLGARSQARIATLRAEVLYFGNGDLDGAATQARAAIALDSTVGQAHLLLATVLTEQGQSNQAELRAAIGCPSPPPEAFARLAISLGATTEGCELARRYLTAAPRGSWATDARALSCP